MAREFTMPKLGLTMTDGTIREWLVAPGTAVQVGESVLVIETDKVETEVEAREAGILHPSADVGENFECGAVIGWLVDEGESPPAGAQVAGAAAAAPAPPAASPSAAASPPPAAAVTAAPAAPPVAAAAPVAADVAARGEHGRILASPRARAAAARLGVDLAAVVGTGPGGRIVAPDVEAHAAGAGATAGGVAAAVPVAADVAARGEHGRILASPRARAAAARLGVDLAAVVGTGPGGRIVAPDVEAHAAQVAAAPAVPAAAVAAATATVPAVGAATSTAAAVGAAPHRGASGAAPLPSGPAATGGARMLAELLGVDLAVVPAAAGARITREDVAVWVRQQLSGATAPSADTGPNVAAEALELPLLQTPTTSVPMRGMRGVIAERMHQSLRDMAQLTLNIDADMTAIEAERARARALDTTAPGYTAWVVAAVSRALRQHGYANSQIADGAVAHLPQVNVGVAVALDDGLIVPVIRDADRQPVGSLHTAVADLAERARSGKLGLDDLEGGTFSVTALGMYGVDGFTPVINPPNTGILGVGRLRTDTNWTDAGPEPVTRMTLSLTWDHRAYDGAPAAEFAQTIVRLLEEPAALTA